MELESVKTQTTWNDAVESINRNNLRVGTEITKLQNATYKNKGYFATADALVSAYPSGSNGSKAYVGTSYPYAIYVWDGSAWVDSGETGGDESVTLGDYYTKEEVDTTLEGFTTEDELATTMEGYYTKEETTEVVESYHVILTQEEYDALEVKEDKLYFTYEEE